VLACCEHRKHIIMVNVEADALAARCSPRARATPASCIRWRTAISRRDLRDGRLGARLWVRGHRCRQGTKYLPEYHASTPATVWRYYGLSEEDARRRLNAQMFNSFLDGTKSAIEMCAVANATGLHAPDGLAFRPAASMSCRRCCGRRARAACSISAVRSK